MSNTLPPLILPIVGDATGLTATFAKIQQQVQTFGSKLNAAIAPVGNALKGLGAGFHGIVGPIIAAAGAYATFTAAMEALNRADELGKMATALGISVESLQELQSVARQTGGSADGMNTALREMSRNISEAAAGDEKAIASFARLGIRIEELKGLNAHEAFLKISDAASTLTNSSDRLVVTQEIFGRGAKDLAETLTIGADGYREIAGEAKAFGLILSETEVRTLKDMGDRIDTMKLTMETLVSKVMVRFESSVSFVADELGRAAKNSEAFSTAGFLMANAFNLVFAVVMDIGKAFYALGVSVGGFFAIFVQGAMDTAEKIWQGMSYAGKVVWEVIKTMGAAFDWLFQAGKIAFYKLKEIGAGVIKDLLDVVGPHIRELGELMSEFGISGGESLVKMGMGMEDFGRNIAVNVMEPMEQAKRDMADDVDTINSTLSRIGNTGSAATPEWMKATQSWLAELSDEYVGIFNGMESSILNLGKMWAGVGIVVDMAHSPLGKAPEDLSEQEKALAKLKESYKEFSKQVSEAAMNATSSKEEDDPAAKERQRYEDQLAIAEVYHDKLKTSEEEYQNQIATIKQTHADNQYAMASKNFSDMTAAAQATRDNNIFMQLESLQIMKENEEAAYQEKMDRMWAEFDGSQEMRAMMDEAAMQHSDNQIAIAQAQSMNEQQINQQKWAAISGIMGQAAALMDKNNKTQFYAWKAFAAGQSIINALLSFSTIMGDPKNELMFGPAGQIALATTSLTLGLAAAAKIAATPFGGGGGSAAGLGGGGGGGGAGARGAANASATRDQANAGSNVNVTLYGDSFSGGQVRGLISAINDQVGDNMSLKAQVA